MKSVAIFMLCISMHSIHSMEIQKRVWDTIPHNKQLTEKLAADKLAQALSNSDPSKPRLAIFASITQEIDQKKEEQKRLELQELTVKQKQLQEKKRVLAIEIQTFISAQNCNKRKTYYQYGYTLQNKNGIIAETKNKQKTTYFKAKDVRDILIYDNFEIEFIF